jgi:Zn-dependent protease
MFNRFRIGTLFGFPIEISTSFLLLLGVIFVWMGGLVGVFTALVAFASVLLHELGHAIVARRLGVPVPSIELNFFGGAAKLGDHPKRANDEIVIAAAGPLVSFALAGLAYAMYALSGTDFFALVATINALIGAFNVLPALPMDGGRILRAALSKRLGFVRATDRSVTIARGFAIAMGAFGIVSGNFHLAILATFLYMIAGRERLLARHLGGYRDEPAVEVLPRGVRYYRGRFITL